MSPLSSNLSLISAKTSLNNSFLGPPKSLPLHQWNSFEVDGIHFLFLILQSGHFDSICHGLLTQKLILLPVLLLGQYFNFLPIKMLDWAFHFLALINDFFCDFIILKSLSTVIIILIPVPLPCCPSWLVFFCVEQAVYDGYDRGRTSALRHFFSLFIRILALSPASKGEYLVYGDHSSLEVPAYGPVP